MNRPKASLAVPVGERLGKCWTGYYRKIGGGVDILDGLQKKMEGVSLRLYVLTKSNALHVKNCVLVAFSTSLVSAQRLVNPV